MKQYKSYMDRQEISPAVHENLLNLEAGKKSARPWMKYGALAACAALIAFDLTRKRGRESRHSKLQKF